MSTWRKRQVSKETNLRIPKLKAFSSEILPLCLLLDEGLHERAALLGSLAYFNFGTEIAKNLIFEIAGRSGC